MQMLELSAAFVNYASDILADTASGSSASQFIRACNAYAIEYGVEIPHTTVQYEARNKRTALAENLMRFQETQRYRIIKELCEHPSVSDRPEVRKLKMQLIGRHGHLAGEALGSDVNEALIEQTRHWLDPFPDALGLYNAALEKHENKIFQRNLLDDLRLSLEILMRNILENNRSLENQFSVKLIDYYSKYQNNYVKHDDAVIEEEIEFMFELTPYFMKHLVRLAQR